VEVVAQPVLVIQQAPFRQQVFLADKLVSELLLARVQVAVVTDVGSTAIQTHHTLDLLDLTAVAVAVAVAPALT
jgi:hypothetical protein